MAAVYSFSQTPEPFFAPLPKPFIRQALELQQKAGTPTVSLPSPYALLRINMLEPRQKTFDELTPVIRRGEFDTDYLLSKLTELTPKKTPENTRPLSAESLSHWRKAGLLRYQEKNAPDYDSGAALLTLRRMVRDRERRWLPSPKQARQHFNEPLWWCWRQDSIFSPVLPCPVPLPPDIPRSALLWTDWRGAAWRPDWLPVGEMGCCRWARTKYFQDTSTLLWDITEEELAELWKVPISGFYRQALTATPLTLHSLATSALLLLGTERLEQLQAFNPSAFSLAG